MDSANKNLVKTAGVPVFDISRISVGLVGVRCVEDGTKRKLFIRKTGAPEQRYILTRGDTVWYPLPYGSGLYTAGIYEWIGDDRYKTAMMQTYDAAMPDPEAVFLQSSVNMEWRADMRCIQKARALAAGLKDDRAKVEAMWRFIINNFSYDQQLAASVKYDYIPDVEKTYSVRKDICFGLTALFNAMLRSIGIKAMMMHGTHVSGVYHAWSRVLLGGKWLTVDVTVDTAFVAAGIQPKLEKDAELYTVKYIY